MENEAMQAARRALQQRDIDAAREHFLKLSALERDHAQWLEDVLRDGYTAGLFDVQAVLSFLESLPNWDWTLDGCCVLQRVNETLGSSSIHVVHLPTLPLAYFLHKLVNHLDGSTKVRAESYWYEWVSPTMRAIVTGSPILIESAHRREVLYTPANNFVFDFDRRNVFSWRAKWTPDEGKELWRLIPANAQRDRFYIQSVRYNEFLYAADYAKFGRDERGNNRSRVFTWRRQDDVGESGHWQLLPLDFNNRDVFALYNPYQKEYLYSPNDVYDRERRYVLTMGQYPNNGAWLEERKWRVVPVTLSSMEQGIEAFFMKRYPDAVKLLTKALDEAPDHTEHVKCYVYRMTANLRMGNTDDIQADFDRVQHVGGDKAAIFHGLHHLWTEVAAFLQPIATEASPDTPIVSIRRLMARGEHYFVHKDYASALKVYQEAASAELETQDKVLRARQVEAQFGAAKCLYVLDQLEAAWSALEAALAMEDISVELEARVLLWMGKCKRQMKSYEEALSMLERSLDRLSTVPEPRSAWLRQCILTEMRVVGIYEKELLTALLSRCDTASDHLGDRSTSADATLQQMLELFHCPLSLELMQDPVMTPNGDTYEREMIERHLEVNGSFDPMTRASLTKAQLYPNRALKMLMETLLDSNHRLGLLLASCST
ncbi:hypothetical protein Poli38472_013742 [Pythium oligandrum]|uniref:RING-type E3 ubiquitin transferase n=1 Tax=Pythium oligandrum TaxID=41045 RepID=A0A8K1CDX5_PYTOL|nr:hypothetical protein Poli38472_013742 [Pythium oligandrum]|eukprot:TMW61279.1 hypothetical protein Poli38472_013742 [Pythium oligandrum]